MNKTVLTQSGTKVQEDLNFSENLFPYFSATSTYDVGAVVRREDKLYKCHSAISTAGTWTGSTNWTETNVANLLGETKAYTVSSMTNLSHDFISNLKVGDLVIWRVNDGGWCETLYVVEEFFENYKVELSAVHDDKIVDVVYLYQNYQWTYYTTETHEIPTVQANSGTPSNILSHIKIGSYSYSVPGFAFDILTQYDDSTDTFSIDTNNMPSGNTSVRFVDYQNSSKVYGFATCRYNINNMQRTFMGFIGNQFISPTQFFSAYSGYTDITPATMGGGGLKLYLHQATITASETFVLNFVSTKSQYHNYYEIADADIVSVRSAEEPNGTVCFVAVTSVQGSAMTGDLTIQGYKWNSNGNTVEWEGSYVFAYSDSPMFSETVTELEND